MVPDFWSARRAAFMTETSYSRKNTENSEGRERVFMCMRTVQPAARPYKVIFFSQDGANFCRISALLDAATSEKKKTEQKHTKRAGKEERERESRNW